MNIRLFVAIAETVMLLVVIAIVMAGAFYIFQSAGDLRSGVDEMTQKIVSGLSAR